MSRKNRILQQALVSQSLIVHSSLHLLLFQMWWALCHHSMTSTSILICVYAVFKSTTTCAHKFSQQSSFLLKCWHNMYPAFIDFLFLWNVCLLETFQGFPVASIVNDTAILLRLPLLFSPVLRLLQRLVLIGCWSFLHSTMMSGKLLHRHSRS